MARAWVDAGTAEWGPLRLLLTAYERLGYRADEWGMGADVVVLLAGPDGPPAAPRPRPRRENVGGLALVGGGAAHVTLDRRGRPAAVLDDVGETWTVVAVTGVWTRLGPLPAPAAVRTAWRLRVACWHTPPPGAAAALDHRGDDTWTLRPPR